MDFWFISDLAIVLYYAVMNPDWNQPDRQAEFERPHGLAWKGYATKHELPDWSHAALALFLALREQTLVAVTARSIPAAERTERWQRFFEAATESIRGGRPALDLRI